MRKQQKAVLVLMIVAAFVATAVIMPRVIRAGSLEPSGPPGSTMVTLDEIYDIVVDTNSKVNAGPCERVPVAKTGVTTSYEPGDDGDLQKGVAWPNPRFTDNGDGTVTDNLTGLIWTKDANIYGERTWSEALSDCAACSVGGYTDWYLPNINELHSLFHLGVFRPALPDTAGTGQLSRGDPFENVGLLQDDGYYYWSSTTSADASGDAWLVITDEGTKEPQGKTRGFTSVWCVRRGQ